MLNTQSMVVHLLATMTLTVRWIVRGVDLLDCAPIPPLENMRKVGNKKGSTALHIHTKRKHEKQIRLYTIQQYTAVVNTAGFFVQCDENENDQI